MVEGLEAREEEYVELNESWGLSSFSLENGKRKKMIWLHQYDDAQSWSQTPSRSVLCVVFSSLTSSSTSSSLTSPHHCPLKTCPLLFSSLLSSPRSSSNFDLCLHLCPFHVYFSSFFFPPTALHLASMFCVLCLCFVIGDWCDPCHVSFVKEVEGQMLSPRSERCRGRMEMEHLSTYCENTPAD